MDFLEKLDFLMDRFDLTKTSLSQKSGIPYTTIDAWYKKGYEGLKLTTLRKLASYFNTTLDYWFMDEITDPNYGKSKGFEVDYTEMEHIKKYRALDNQGKKHIDYELDREVQRTQSLAELQQQISAQSTQIVTLEDTRPYYISYYQRMTSAGNGEYLFDDIPTDLICVKDTSIARQADFVLGVNGDSMEPTYHDGDKVFVEKTDMVQIGDIGIFFIGNECFIKEAGENGLISHNPKYKIIPGTESIRCVGHVLGKVEN